MTVIKQLETLGMDNQTPSWWHCMMEKKPPKTSASALMKLLTVICNSLTQFAKF